MVLGFASLKTFFQAERGEQSTCLGLESLTIGKEGRWRLVESICSVFLLLLLHIKKKM